MIRYGRNDLKGREEVSKGRASIGAKTIRHGSPQPAVGSYRGGARPGLRLNPRRMFSLGGADANQSTGLYIADTEYRPPSKLGHVSCMYVPRMCQFHQILPREYVVSKLVFTHDAPSLRRISFLYSSIWQVL